MDYLGDVSRLVSTKRLAGTDTNGQVASLHRIAGHELGTEWARGGHKAKRQPFGLAFATALGRVFPGYSVVARAGFEPATFGL